MSNLTAYIRSPAAQQYKRSANRSAYRIERCGNGSKIPNFPNSSRARATFAQQTEIEVVNAMKKAALGMEFTKETNEATAQKVIEYDPKTGKKVKEYTTDKLVPKMAKREFIVIPPSVEAGKFMLKNMAPERWKDKQEIGGVVEDHTGKKKIDYSKSSMYEAQCRFIDEVAKLERFALRLGELSFTGWKQDMHSKKWKPDFKQKSVDMKFGLDIATMATKHVVDKIVLVAGDSDFIAPIKMARKRGYLFTSIR